MPVGDKTKLLWQNPAYRKRMSEAHKGQVPPSRKGALGNRGSFKKGLIPWSKGKKLSAAHRLKLSMGHKGRTPWNKGLGNITPEHKRLKNSMRYKDWREAVFKRDDYTCQKCRVRGGYLHPHHVQNFAYLPELRFDLDNGIILCIGHHREFHKIYGLRKRVNLNNLIEYLKS